MSTYSLKNKLKLLKKEAVSVTAAWSSIHALASRRPLTPAEEEKKEGLRLRREEFLAREKELKAAIEESRKKDREEATVSAKAEKPVFSKGATDPRYFENPRYRINEG